MKPQVEFVNSRQENKKTFLPEHSVQFMRCHSTSIISKGQTRFILDLLNIYKDRPGRYIWIYSIICKRQKSVILDPLFSYFSKISSSVPQDKETGLYSLQVDVPKGGWGTLMVVYLLGYQEQQVIMADGVIKLISRFYIMTKLQPAFLPSYFRVCGKNNSSTQSILLHFHLITSFQSFSHFTALKHIQERGLWRRVKSAILVHTARIAVHL